ncbi:hypothetical protein GCM10011360_08910 [Primorskyibacter flagellatus]|uniref:Uncharacterized protein n=1 Tax=Primorskyibacter flagellatus TaxID=1387277 RepID=A0A917A1U0_9RHOB|nr:hypothetical protein [Primorskyibacter flagellatus]GGE22648.1 hypothetical protein GCM10011360_08910 [Primorskyibacter flagellatus]
MAAPAAAVPAAVYVAGAGLVAGAVWLMTPAGQRASQSLGEAIVDGGATAVDNIRNLIQGEEEDTAPPQAIPQTQADTDTATRRCDGPHRGRFQAQGYRPSQEPRPVETSVPWVRDCFAPQRAEGRGMVSLLLVQTQAISRQGAGLRGACFSRMSQHVNSAPPSGFTAGHRAGWGINPAGQVRRNTAAGPNAPRVDLEVQAGRAFGDV